MNDVLTKVIIFTAGAAIGSYATWKLIDYKYAKLAEDEIESVREYYRERNDKDHSHDDHETMGDDKIVIAEVRNEYKEMVDGLGYSNNEDDEDRPYLIEPGEYGAFNDYEEHSLTYWSDGFVSDDYNDEIIEDVDDVIGIESLDLFGEYEEGVVHVRNDVLKCDYEITKDNRKYMEVIKVDMED